LVCGTKYDTNPYRAYLIALSIIALAHMTVSHTTHILLSPRVWVNYPTNWLDINERVVSSNTISPYISFYYIKNHWTFSASLIKLIA
jgi:hypothetical protein